MSKEILRKKNPEVSIEHKLGILLSSKTLSRGELSGLLIILHQHSKKEDWAGLMKKKRRTA